MGVNNQGSLKDKCTGKRETNKNQTKKKTKTRKWGAKSLRVLFMWLSSKQRIAMELKRMRVISS